jgi:hypothetical protein
MSKPQRRLSLPKHWHGGEPMPGSPEKRSIPSEARHTFPYSVGCDYRRIVSTYPGTPPPAYSRKRNET